MIDDSATDTLHAAQTKVQAICPNVLDISWDHLHQLSQTKTITEPMIPICFMSLIQSIGQHVRLYRHLK